MIPTVMDEWIPRPVKAILCFLCAALLAFAYYIALGSPTFTLEQKFRQAEKANLVGPSQIVDHQRFIYNEYDDLLVGQSEYGITFFARRDNSGAVQWGRDWQYVLTYVEKTDDITVAVPYSEFGYFWGSIPVEMPVYVYADVKDAVRVTVSLEIRGTYTVQDDGNTVTKSYAEQFAADGEAISDSIFFMTLTSTNETGGKALYALSCLASGNPEGIHGHTDTTICVTALFYDANNQLLQETTVYINQP